MKKYLLLFIFLFSFSICEAQVMYSKIFGDTSNDCRFNRVIGTSDGGLLVSGWDLSTVDTKLILIKLDTNGDTAWTTILRHLDSYYSIPSVAELSNQNGYIVCGSTSDFFPTRGFLCNIDINGNVGWSKAYSNDTTESFFIDDIIVTTSDSLVLACRTSPGSCSLMKTDFSGNIGWMVNVDEHTDVPLKLLRAQNDDIIFSSGHRWQSSSRAFLMRVDGSGNLIWSKVRSMLYHYYPHVSFMDTTDNGQFIMTVTVNDIDGFPYLFYMKVDANGNVLWQRTLSGLLTLYSNAMAYSLPGNKYGIIGDGEPFDRNTFVLTMDSFGIPMTTRVDTSWHTSRPSFAKTINGQLAYVGGERDTVTLKYRIKIFLADSVGNTLCNQINDTLDVDTNLTFSFSNTNTTLTSSSVQVFNLIMQTAKGIPVQTECSTSVNITGDEKQSEINLYPNPFSSSLTLHFPSPQNTPALLKIFNSIGEAVLEKEIKLEDQTLSLAALPQGIYLVSVMSEGRVYNQKIVK